jgi:YfiH family protein
MTKKIFWPRFEKEIVAFTSTRQGGYSKAPFASLNLAYHVGDDPKAVKKNRSKLFEEMGLNENNTVIVHQFHSDIAHFATKADVGKGYESFESGVRADALVSTESNLYLGIYHADCVPVFIYIPSKKIVAIIHAGEEGTLNEITRKTVATIKDMYQVSGEEIYAYLGPSLTFGHRLITKEKALKILKDRPDFNYGVKGGGDEYFLDLPFMNFMQLRDLGVPATQIDIFEECTYENADDFFSFARENSTGRLMSFIAIK